jgi:hypothetical protein
MYAWSSSFTHQKKSDNCETSSLISDDLKFPNGLANDPTSIAFCATMCFINIGSSPMSGTDFTIFMPHAVNHCSIGFNRFFSSISPVDAVGIYISVNWIDSSYCLLSMNLLSLIVCGLTITSGVAATVFPVLTGLPIGWAYNSCWM